MEFGKGNYRAILAHEKGANVTVVAEPQPATHTILKRKIDLLR